MTLDTDPRRLRAWVEALCSEACGGRAPGTREGEAARAVVVEGLRRTGIEPALLPVPGGPGVNVLWRTGGGTGGAVLVGAHYDHLGRGGPGGGTYWGADDNAAAVAVLLEVARGLAVRPAAGEIALVAFDCEEPPHFLTPTMGSMAFTREPPIPLERISLAIILDLVGHAVGPPGTPPAVARTLLVLGAETSEGTSARVDRAAGDDPAVVVRRLGGDLVPPLSDYEPFRRAGVPFVFLTCGRWRHYHTVEDTPDRLDYDKLAGVARFVDRLARDAAAHPRPSFDDGGRDQAGTIATLLDLARALAPVAPQAGAAVAALEAIAGRLDGRGRVPLADWSRVLMLAGLLEQGLS
jgi:hypothetical protein